VDQPLRPAAAVAQDEERGDRCRSITATASAASARRDRLGRRRHQVARGQRAQSPRALEPAAEIAVGDHATSRRRAFTTPVTRPFGGDGEQRVLERRAFGTSGTCHRDA